MLSSRSTPRSTETPVPVPTDSPAPATLVPGLTTAGVTDPARLDRSHREALSRENGFRIEREGLSRYADGFERTQSRLTAARNGTAYRIAARQGSDRIGLVDEPVTAVVVWFDAGGTFRRTTDADGTVRASRLDARAARAASEHVDIALPAGVRQLFAAFDRIDVSTVDPGYRLRADEDGSVPGLPRQPGDVAPRDARLSARVRRSGQVGWYTLRYVATAAEDETVARNALVRFDPNRPARLERPEWVTAIVEDE